MLDRPTPGRRDHHEGRVGVHRVRRADAREQRDVENAVAAGVALAQIHGVVVGPPPDGAQLACAPHESLVEAARVAALLCLVGRGDEVVEPVRLGEGRDHVDRGRGGEDQPVALGPEGGQSLRGERGDQLAQGGHRPAPGRLDLVLAPAPGHPGGGPHEAHGEQVLSEAVVDGVEQPVARERATLGEHALVHQGAVEDLAGGMCEQRAVQVDEDGACAPLVATATQPKAVPLPRRGPRPPRTGVRERSRSDRGLRTGTAAERARNWEKGPPGGRAIPSQDSSGLGGGASDSLRSDVHFGRPVGNQSSSFRRYFHISYSDG